jgi:NAD(P)-dependent dehydrogenase (short-subunit alcohol dehydrogenase family)
VDVIDLTGRVAIVTGAGRGLGRLYARELARRGASVVVNDVGTSMDGAGADPAVADRVVEEIGQAGGAAVASHDSVDTPEGGDAIVHTAVERFGRLDAVVSNAGIFQTVPFADLTPPDWRRMLQVHLDDVAAHLADVTATEPFTVPGSIFDEVAGIADRLGITGCPNASQAPPTAPTTAPPVGWSGRTGAGQAERWSTIGNVSSVRMPAV